MGLTKVYLLLDEPVNIDGLQFPAGPRLSTDDHWTRQLRTRGARVLTENEFDALTAPPAATPAASLAVAPTPAPSEGIDDAGTRDADDSRGDQISAFDSIQRSKPRRANRRV